MGSTTQNRRISVYTGYHRRYRPHNLRREFHRYRCSSSANTKGLANIRRTDRKGITSKWRTRDLHQLDGCGQERFNRHWAGGNHRANWRTRPQLEWVRVCCGPFNPSSVERCTRGSDRLRRVSDSSAKPARSLENCCRFSYRRPESRILICILLVSKPETDIWVFESHAPKTTNDRLS